MFEARSWPHLGSGLWALKIARIISPSYHRPHGAFAGKTPYEALRERPR